MAAFALLVCLLSAACSSTEGPPGLVADEVLPDEVSVVVGRTGGIVKAKGVSLEIPEGALDKDVTITAKKTQETKRIAGVKPVSNAYEFGPKGTTFKKDVKLSLELKKPEPEAKVYFTKEGSDTAFEQLASLSKDQHVSAKIRHFSLGFAGVEGAEDDDLEELDAGLEMPSDPTDASNADPDASEPASDLPDAAQPAQPRHIVVISQNSAGTRVNQNWAAVQDGDGAWHALAAPTSPGTYEFDVSSSRFGFAIFCSREDGLTSSGQVWFGTSDTALEPVQVSPDCAEVPTPTYHQISGSLTLPPGAVSFIGAHPYGYGSNLLEVDDAGVAPYVLEPIPENVEVQPVIVVADGSGSWLKVEFLTPLTLTADRVVDVDLNTGGGPAQPSVLKVTGASAATQIAAAFTTNLATSGLPLTFGPIVGETERTQSFYSFEGLVMYPTDRYRLYASDAQGADFREVTYFTQEIAEPVLHLPPVFTPVFSVLPGAHLRPSASFADVPDAAEYNLVFEDATTEPPGRIEVRAHRNWFTQGEAQHSIEMPDLSGVAGFSLSWLSPSSASASVWAGVTRRVTNGDGQLTSFANRRGHVSTQPAP